MSHAAETMASAAAMLAVTDKEQRAGLYEENVSLLLLEAGLRHSRGKYFFI